MPAADPRHEALRGVLAQWLEASNAADADRLAKLYAPSLRFYGATMPPSKAVALKRKAQTTQSIVEGPRIFVRVRVRHPADSSGIHRQERARRE